MITPTAQWEGSVPASSYTNARWVWAANPAAPFPNIKLEHEFSLICPDLPLTVRVNVDNYATYRLNGVVTSTTDWRVESTATIPTTGLTCDEPLLLEMDLINEGEIGGIIYEVTSPECIDSCTGGYCGCRPCSYYMPGCAECSSSTVCTACELHQYRVNAPPVGGNTCPCMDRFYQNDAGICVPCPLDKNCATCTFN